ncbi:MAG: TrkA family potassium uptake protein [Haloarculaceae archaeon]
MDLRRLPRLVWRQQNTSRQRRRVVLYLVGLTAVVFAYALVYQAAMAAFENQSVSLSKALLAVSESFTTTGYGEDAALWTTWPLHLLAVAMQLTGVSLIFLALPVFLAPWVEEILATVAPTEVGEISDHVVVCGYSSRGAALAEELSARDVPYVILEPDRERAADVYEQDANVIHADPETTDGLASANVQSARALVADVDDETNASIALTADQVDGVRTITFVEDPTIADYHRYAGADEVFSPRQLVGESLARKVTAGISVELDDAVELGGEFEVVELPVQSGSPLVGKTVAESGIHERTGTNVIGAWFRGEFDTPPSPDARIDDQTILLAAGRDEQLERLKELTLSERRASRGGTVVIAGHGEVGSTVDEALSDADVECVTVDVEDGDGVDVVGDVTDVSTLADAGVDDAASIILALADDTVTVFATLVVREYAPDLEIIARADATGSVQKLYQAGADYVLALATVSGRMLAATILEEDVLTFDQQVEIIRTDCGALAGQTLAEADVRARTGCTVLAVERDRTVVTDVGPDFRVEQGDQLVVAGTDADMNRFAALVE